MGYFKLENDMIWFTYLKKDLWMLWEKNGIKEAS